MATRWGICGAGMISQDFCSALLSLSRDEHQLVAVASRDKSRALEFAQKYGVRKAYGSYEELAKDPDVDVIYVGTISGFHSEQSLLFLNHGKNVLCEPPMALSLRQAQEIFQAARSKNVFFMEAYWFLCGPLFEHVRQQLTAGNLGEIKLARGSVLFDLSFVDWLKHKRLGGSGLMNFGNYLIMVSNFLFKDDPSKMTVESNFKGEVDESGVITLRYSEDRMASLVYHWASPGSNVTGASFLIAGSKAKMEIASPFWCPTKVTTYDDRVLEFPLPKTDQSFNFDTSPVLQYGANHVRQCLQKGLKESPLLTLDDSKRTMSTLHILQKQLGLNFDSFE